MNNFLDIAILESIKPHEFRIPLHPKHFEKINLGKNRLIFQSDYAKHFGAYEQVIKDFGFTLAPRDELLKSADVIFLLKLMPADLEQMKSGAIVIGWCHAAQQIEITKIAKKRRLTLIAMEAMYRYNGKEREHLFRENNFIAGSLGIEHALASVPYSYDKNARIAIISYGTVSQGAVFKLIERGFLNITIFSQRKQALIEDQLSQVRYEHLLEKDAKLYTSNGASLKKKLLEADIIVNGVMQNILKPYFFLSKNDLRNKKNKLIIDLSCDDQMGFDFACTTPIDNPILYMGDNFYYGVDHVPTLAWKYISIHISEQLFLLVNAFLQNQFDKDMYTMLKNATEIQNGRVINRIITEYQNRIRG